MRMTELEPYRVQIPPRGMCEKRWQVWHETDRQAYGGVLIQSGNNHKLGVARWQQCVGW